MLSLNEVLSFSRDYINNKKERTLLRKKKIREVYRELFEKDINGSCSTCYIEALLEIVNKKIANMATANYELKRGVLLQSFGHPERACTNDTLTDELAEWYLTNHPEKAVYFSRISPNFKPVTGTPLPPPIPPPVRTQSKEKWIVAPDKIIIPEEKMIAEIIEPAKETPKEEIKVEKRVAKKTKTKK